MNEQKQTRTWNIILAATGSFAVLAVIVLISGIISHKTVEPSPTEPPVPTEPASYTIMDSFDSLVADTLTEANESALSVKKHFWIEDDAEIAPLPNPACYGETDDPSSLQWLLDEAANILEGQETVFRTDVELVYNSHITYYLDESIFVITWQEVRDNFVYTYSEVKISDPSQFRRYLANNEYDSDYMYPVSKMGTMVNAVMASSADYYRGRNHGIIVYEGEVKRAKHSEVVDTCFIDKNGDLILVPAGELVTVEEAQKFVDDNDIDFSLAFGPILVDNGQRCEPANYYLGEVNDNYPRAALCQKDSLHYVVVVANGNLYHWDRPDIHTFANRIDELGCEKAYTLDGGKTGTIAMQGRALNPTQGPERWISDIIYFATAIPSSATNENGAT